MMKWMLAAGAAALAITAPSAAERGGGGKDRGQAAKVERGGGGEKARAQRSGGGQKARVQRSGGDRQARAQRGGSERQARAQRSGGNREARAARSDRGGRDRARGQEMRFGAFAQNDDRRRGKSEARAARNDDRGRRNEVRAARNDDRGRRNDQARIENRGGDRARVARVDDDRRRGRDRNDARIIQFDRRGDRDEIRVQNRDRDGMRIARFDDDRVFRVRDVDRGRVRFRDVDRDDLFVRRLGWGAGGCPPGLDKKNNGCLPPGQAAKFIGQPLIAATRFAALDPLPRSFRSLYWDDDDYYYRYGGGYLYRVDRDDDLIDGLLPLFGAALLGQPLRPAYVNSYYRPSYYNAFYPNSPYDCYQYGYGYVYETDCMTGLVEDVIPTYDYGYGVGQLMPASYSYYNLPYTYRSYFNDDDDYYYRYAPGAIYRVDRGTSLVSAVVALLTGGLSVGQPLPVGYSAYNVPLAYRSTYYDRPDMWYRYDNGYIYGVDPRTRVVSNVAYVIV